MSCRNNSVQSEPACWAWDERELVDREYICTTASSNSTSDIPRNKPPVTSYWKRDMTSHRANKSCLNSSKTQKPKGKKRMRTWRNRSMLTHRANKSCLSSSKTQKPKGKKRMRNHSMTTHRAINSCLKSLTTQKPKLKKGARNRNMTTLPAVNKSCSNCSTTQKPKVKKRVQFHCSAKAWDGPREEHVRLERLAVEFWGKRPSTAVLDELVNDVNESMLLKLRNLVMDAIERVNQSKNTKGTQLVPGGGGKHGIRLKACNVPHAKLLICKINEAFVKVIGKSFGTLHDTK